MAPQFPAALGRVARRARRLLNRLGVDVVRTRMAAPVPPDFSPEEAHIWDAVSPYTMTSPERAQASMAAARYVAAAGIPGDIVECGVWRGGSMMAMALALLRAGDASRHLHLFDTFEGMTPPGAQDRSLDGRSAQEQLEEDWQDKETGVWCQAAQDAVQKNLATTGYPSGLVHLVRGRVEDTLPANAPQHIAILRLDTDWYASTRHELLHLFPRLSPGGVLLVDDYGHWEGARAAVDEYLREHAVRAMLVRTDYTGRLLIKPG